MRTDGSSHRQGTARVRALALIAAIAFLTQAGLQGRDPSLPPHREDKLALSVWMSRACAEEVHNECWKLAEAGKSREVICAILPYLWSPYAVVRWHAVNSLLLGGSLPPGVVLPVFRERLLVESSDAVRGYMILAMASFADGAYEEGDMALLRRLIDDPNGGVRVDAFSALVEANRKEGLTLAGKMRKDTDPRVRAVSISILLDRISAVGDDWVYESLVCEPDRRNWGLIIQTLGRMETAQSVGVLNSALGRESSPEGRLRILRELCWTPYSSTTVRRVLGEAAESDPDSAVRKEAKKLLDEYTEKWGQHLGENRRGGRFQCSSVGLSCGAESPSAELAKGGRAPSTSPAYATSNRLFVALGSRTERDMPEVAHLCEQLRGTQLSDKDKILALDRLSEIASPGDALAQRTLVWLIEHAKEGVASSAARTFGQFHHPMARVEKNVVWLVPEAPAALVRACKSDSFLLQASALQAAWACRVEGVVPIIMERIAAADHSVAWSPFLRTAFARYLPDARVRAAFGEALIDPNVAPQNLVSVCDSIRDVFHYELAPDEMCPLLPGLVLHLQNSQNTESKWRFISAIQQVSGKEFCYASYEEDMSRARLLELVEDRVVRRCAHSLLQGGEAAPTEPAD